MMHRDSPATGAESCTPALVRAREALLTAVMAADPSSASTSVVSRTAKGNFLPLGTTPAITHSELVNRFRSSLLYIYGLLENHHEGCQGCTP